MEDDAVSIAARMLSPGFPEDFRTKFYQISSRGSESGKILESLGTVGEEDTKEVS